MMRYWSACAAISTWLLCQAAWADGVGAQLIVALEHYRVAVLQMDFDDEIASFTQDAELSQGKEAPIQGRAQIRALILSQAAFKTVGYELRPVATRVLGSVAIQNGIFSRRSISPQHESTIMKGVFEVQWARQADGSWLISRLHTDPLEDQPHTP